MDEINNLSRKEQHLFDGKQHWTLNDRGEATRPVTGVPLKYGGIPSDVIKPDYFFRELRYGIPIVGWLKQSQVHISPTMEKVAGRNCYVVKCEGGENTAIVRLWLSPELEMRPLKTEWVLRNGSRNSYIVRELKELEEDLWFPVKGTVESHIPDPTDGEDTILYSVAEFEVDLSTLKVNQGIPDERFEPNIPR